MRKQDTTSTFNEGLVMDFNPLVTPNNVLVNCLNGTITTFSGNENVLLNDMGNGRVETAFLPEGYVPIGTAELGGIIYIVSYNPLIDKCLIGSFPSPERNITSDEIQSPKISINNSQFQKDGKIINTILKVKLLSNSNSEDGIFKLNPGDKYTIYSTNKGISNNSDRIENFVVHKGTISDVGNTKNIVDTDPRYVTIHVVSIGEDGKIVYLDDSLKWTDDSGSPANYYIKECEGGEEDIKKDIDEYRSLVSSAYNIFNSKVSGELALLFELKVIDTFSATWDAEVRDIEEDENNKEATINFNIDYTSSHNNIKLRYVILSKTEFPNKLMNTSLDLIKGQTHCVIPEGSGKNNITTTIAKFKYKSSGSLSDYIWNYSLTPAMPFGYLDFLTISGSINFLEIGSGKITLDEWRYFIQDDDFYLNWGLSAYPEKNKKINKVIMSFIPFTEVNRTNIQNFEKNFIKNKLYAKYVISGKKSYSGYFLELLPFETINLLIQNAKIIRNLLYLVDVCIDYNGEYRHNYKWLYTTKLWNDVFIHNTEVTDFTELKLDDVINLNPKFNIIDNIVPQVYNSKITFPRTHNDLNQPYEVAGALITTVNFKGNSFDTDKTNLEVNVETVCDSDLFAFNKSPNDSYQFTLGDTYITHDDFIPKSDTRESALANLVISIVGDTVASDLGTTINTILENGIKSKEIDDKAIDSFSTKLNTSGNKLNINVIGAIFSRINADLLMSSVSIGLEIKPMLYNVEDYKKVGLKSFSEFEESFTEDHGDRGGGQPFYFHFTSTGGLDYASRKSDWNPTDKWKRTNWWDDIPPYTDHLNVQMLNASGSFLIMHYIGGRDIMFLGKYVKGEDGLWAKSSEGYYIPINCFGKPSQLASTLANLYAQLYYVDINSIPKELSVVTNINYLSNYSETWNINIKCKLKINNINDSIIIKSKTDSFSLTLLQNNCSNLPINYNNITVTNFTEKIFDPKLISHTFYILNVDLYNLYDNLKSTNIPAVSMLSTNESWEKCLPKTANSVYVYDKNTKDFKKLDKNSARNITYGGTITNNGSDRLILTPGTLEASTSIYDYFEFTDNELTINQSGLLSKKYMFEFLTDSSGHPWSVVYNNSGYGLLKDYEK